MNLVQLATSLRAKKQDLEERLRKIARHTRRRTDPLPQDFAEQAQELENEEVLFALDSQIATALVATTRALARIELGEYSHCVGCGGEISETRLTALPYSVFCIDCAESREQAASSS